MRQVFNRRTATPPCALQRRRPAHHRLQFETLEPRMVMDATPFGALAYDTSEYMLGSVTATVVLLESNGAIDANLENWTPATIQAAKDRVTEALAWWEDLLVAQGSVHDLTFHIDFTMADQPVASSYEPIAGSSLNYILWVDEFLDLQGVDPSEDFYDRGRLFNHAQRLAHETNWAITIFVVNDDLDPDDRFASGGALGGFAVPSGGFIVVPASRPASTFAHETGHLFWAVDEYAGGRSYYDSRGYYNTQNTNGFNDHPQPSTREISIMDNHIAAFPLHAISRSAREMIGWKDSDGDGVFDVADVPLTLSGTGAFNEQTDLYRFLGTASVNALRNQNPSGRNSDITLNEVSRLQVRFDSGAWSDVAEIHAYHSQLDVEFAVPLDAVTIELRVIDDATGMASNVFAGSVVQPSATVDGTVQGFVWFDENNNGIFDSSETPDVGAVVRLLSSTGIPVAAPEVASAADFTAGTTLGVLASGVELRAIASSLPTPSLSVADSGGESVFAYRQGAGPWTTLWTSTSPTMKVMLGEPNSYLVVEIAGGSAGGYGRITAYDADHKLLTRVTTELLAAGQRHRAFVTSDDGDIAYIVIQAHGPGGIAIHSVQIGADVTASVNAIGGYSLDHVLPGVYKVAVASSNEEMTSPDRQVHINPGTTLSNINFALVVAPSWRNSNLLGDVDEDGWVTTLDLAYFVAELRIRGPRSLLEFPPIHGHLVDLDGDNYLTTFDLALLVNAIRNRPLFHEAAGPDEGEGESVAQIVVDVEAAGAAYEVQQPAEAEQLVAPLEVGFAGILDEAAVPSDSKFSEHERRSTSGAAQVGRRVFVAAVEELLPPKKLERARLLDACFDDGDLWSPWEELRGSEVAAGYDSPSAVAISATNRFDGVASGS